MQPESALEQGDSWGARQCPLLISTLQGLSTWPSLARTHCRVGRFRANISPTASGPILALAPQSWPSLGPQNPLDLPAVPAPRRSSHCGSASGKCRTELWHKHSRIWSRLKGSILTWFSQEAPCQGLSAVATNTAAEQCWSMEMPLLRGSPTSEPKEGAVTEWFYSPKQCLLWFPCPPARLALAG